MLKIWVSALCVWLGLAGAGSRRSGHRRTALALAREVIVLSGGEAMFTDMLAQMRPMMLQDFQSRGVGEEVANRFIEVFTEEFAREAPRFVELSAMAYANAYNDQELRDIAAFCVCRPGRAWVQRQSEISGAMMRAGMIIGEEVAARALERVAQTPPPAYAVNERAASRERGGSICPSSDALVVVHRVEDHAGRDHDQQNVAINHHIAAAIRSGRQPVVEIVRDRIPVRVVRQNVADAPRTIRTAPTVIAVPIIVVPKKPEKISE